MGDSRRALRVELRPHALGRVSHFGGHRDVARTRLKRAKSARSLMPEARLGIARSQLNGAFEHFLCALGIAASKQDLAEPPVHARIPRRLLAGGDEDVLRFGQALRFDVHPRDREKHGDVVRVPLRGYFADLLDERDTRTVAQCVAKQDCGRCVRISPPTLNEIVDRVVHQGHAFHCPSNALPTRAKPEDHRARGGHSAADDAHVAGCVLSRHTGHEGLKRVRRSPGNELSNRTSGARSFPDEPRDRMRDARSKDRKRHPLAAYRVSCESERRNRESYARRKEASVGIARATPGR
jgi:hypothetical protein